MRQHVSIPQSLEDATLENLKNKCSLKQPPAVVAETINAMPSPPDSGVSGTGGKTLFVDCLVDATVHVLDMIWHAPVRKSIAFLQNVRSTSSVCTGEIKRPCQCPVGAPFTGGIPLDLFIRETLRRSRTSCSTLQAALLYCKRVGGEAIRKRAEREGVELNDEEKEILNGQARAYPSLTKSLDEADAQSLAPALTADPILCSRRTFLAAVMTSSKFLQDRTFSNRAWSKISGLSVKELGVVERRMLDAIEFDLYVGDDEWQSWTNYLKGDWKAGIDSCRCRLPSPGVVPDHVEMQQPRKTLERTSSLRVDEKFDTEAQPAAVRQTTSVVTSSPSSVLVSESNVSTPTPSNLKEFEHRTPTKSSTYRREPALLPMVISNNLANFVKDEASKQLNTHPTSSAPPTVNNLATPFPMRKGLANRSMSSQ